MPSQVTPEAILDFWFCETKPSRWFKKDPEFDQLICQRFGPALEIAASGGLAAWRTSAPGRFAEIIVLDQFSRNCFRGSARAFQQDAIALGLAEKAIAAGDAAALTPNEKQFLYLPFMHSESLKVHERALELFSEPGLEDNYRFEKLHKELIERFGRFPHRNAVLGRVSTDAEIEFMKTHPGF